MSEIRDELTHSIDSMECSIDSMEQQIEALTAQRDGLLAALKYARPFLDDYLGDFSAIDTIIANAEGEQK